MMRFVLGVCMLLFTAAAATIDSEQDKNSALGFGENWERFVPVSVSGDFHGKVWKDHRSHCRSRCLASRMFDDWGRSVFGGAAFEPGAEMNTQKLAD
jgi:hypothetical protein